MRAGHTRASIRTVRIIDHGPPGYHHTESGRHEFVRRHRHIAPGSSIGLARVASGWFRLGSSSVTGRHRLGRAARQRLARFLREVIHCTHRVKLVAVRAFCRALDHRRHREE